MIISDLSDKISQREGELVEARREVKSTHQNLAAVESALVDACCERSKSLNRDWAETDRIVTLQLEYSKVSLPVRN